MFASFRVRYSGIAASVPHRGMRRLAAALWFPIFAVFGCSVALPDWADIGVTKQSPWFEKTKFLECDRPIGRLSYGAFDGQPGSELAVLQSSYDETGPALDVTFVDLSGNAIGSRRVRPENREDPGGMSIIDVDGDGHCEFLVSEGRLLDGNGRLMASFFTPYPAHYRYVDYDRDGALDFYTFMGGYFKVVDRFGKTVDEWPLETYSDRGLTRQIYLYDARILDFDGDGLCDRVYVTRKERSYHPYEYKLHVRSGDGTVSRTIEYPQRGWTVSPFPGQTGRRFLLQYVGQEVQVLPFDGSPAIAQLEPAGFGLSGAVTEVAGFDAEQEFLIIAQHYKHQGRLVGYSDFRLFLYLYDAEGRLVYSEVLDSRNGTANSFVAVVPSEGDSPAALFVAEGSIVWRYTAKERTKSVPATSVTP